MNLVDANVLLYAVNAASPQHEAAKAWLDDALSSGERLGIPWLSLLAFLRIATHPSIFPRPLTVDQALDVVHLWCGAPHVVHPEPTRGFAATFAHVMRSGAAPGNLATDAYLAALAIEYDANVATFDRDFTRFPGIHTIIPSARRDDGR